MRGRVHVDFDGALSDFNAMCADKMPATRDLTEAERFVMDQALRDAGVDLSTSAVEPAGDSRLFEAIGVGICAAVFALMSAVLIVAAIHNFAATVGVLAAGIVLVVIWAFWPHGKKAER